MSKKETIGKTFFVAGILCVVCSFVVALSVISLRDKQKANIKTDKRMNILAAAGVYKDGMSDDDVNRVYEESVEVKYLQLPSGEYLAEEPASGFDSVKAAKSQDFGELIPAEKDLADIKRRSKVSEVYLFKNQGQVSRIILPVRGKGLWSTMMGFAAVDTDGQTISGLTFYAHAETPGLGGEIDNPGWKAKWPGKKIYNDSGDVELSVIKGAVLPTSPKLNYQVDGLAGATITSRGVSNMIHYWFGKEGYQNYLAKIGGAK